MDRSATSPTFLTSERETQSHVRSTGSTIPYNRQRTMLAQINELRKIHCSPSTAHAKIVRHVKLRPIACEINLHSPRKKTVAKQGRAAKKSATPNRPQSVRFEVHHLQPSCKRTLQQATIRPSRLAVENSSNEGSFSERD